jgi:hypothetical protein
VNCPTVFRLTSKWADSAREPALPSLTTLATMISVMKIFLALCLVTVLAFALADCFVTRILVPVIVEPLVQMIGLI